MRNQHNISGQLQLRQEIYAQAVDYFRSHPDIFIITVMGISLNLYQRLMVRVFFKYNYVMYITSRGLGKTFISTLCMVAWCLLYPNQKCGCIAPSFRQAKMILQEKYNDELKVMSPFLAQEEKNFVCNNAKARVDFYNGSFIECFPIGIGSGTNAAAKIRGARLNCCLVDECVYVSHEIIENVLIPMLIVQSGYEVGKKGGTGISNKLLMVSSAGYRFNHAYKRYCEWTKEMIKPNNTQYFTMTLPWQVGVAVGLFKEDFIMQQKKTMSDDKFAMEYEGLFPKLIDGTWIDYTDLIECSDLMHIETSGVGDFEYIMSVDVARSEGKDNTICDVFKLHWYQDHVECDLIYTKSMNGVTFANQAKTIRNILKKFPNVIRIYLDTNGLGIGLADELAKDYYDADEEKWFPPLIDMNNEQQMKNIVNGAALIYGIKATAEINHNMGMAIKTFTQRRWLHMYPLNADEQRKVDLTSEEDLLLLESEETRSEIMNIKNKPISNSTYVKFYTTSNRKDRWSALCMGLYGAEILRKERNDNSNNMECLIGISRR